MYMSQILSKSELRLVEMCLAKIVNKIIKNPEYRSQRPNLNKLETKSPRDSPNQI